MRHSQLLSPRALAAAGALFVGLAAQLVPAGGVVHAVGVVLCLGALGTMAALGPLTAVRDEATPPAVPPAHDRAREPEPPV